MSDVIDSYTSVVHGRRVDIKHHYDSGMGPPWKEYDNSGPVRDIRSRDEKRPEERLFDDGHAYDWQAAMKKARAEGWGLSIEHFMDLTCELRRAPTKGQVAERAVQRDFDRLKAWCDNEWFYVYITVEDVETGVEGGSCCGVESDDADCIAECVCETVDEMWPEVLKALLDGGEEAA